MSMIVILNAPPESAVAMSALHFSQAALKLNQLNSLFLLGPGVLNAQRKRPNNLAWGTLAAEVPIHCCVASAKKFDLADQKGLAKANLHASFHLSGLTELVVKASQSKVVTFGQRGELL